MDFRKIGTVAFILVFSLATRQSAAENANTHTSFTSCTALSRLIAFVSIETSYPPITNCPTVRVTSNEKLSMLVSHKIVEHGEVPLAVYLPASSKIWISIDIDLTTLLGQSYLLHEIVHAHQFQHGVADKAPCIGWLEREAYQLQANFLKQNGAGSEALKFDILGFLHSACAQAYHPDFNAP